MAVPLELGVRLLEPHRRDGLPAAVLPLYLCCLLLLFQALWRLHTVIDAPSGGDRVTYVAVTRRRNVGRLWNRHRVRGSERRTDGERTRCQTRYESGRPGINNGMNNRWLVNCGVKVLTISREYILRQPLAAHDAWWSALILEVLRKMSRLSPGF